MWRGLVRAQGDYGAVFEAGAFAECWGGWEGDGVSDGWLRGVATGRWCGRQLGRRADFIAAQDGWAGRGITPRPRHSSKEEGRWKRNLHADANAASRATRRRNSDIRAILAVW